MVKVQRDKGGLFIRHGKYKARPPEDSKFMEGDMAAKVHLIGTSELKVMKGLIVEYWLMSKAK